VSPERTVVVLVPAGEDTFTAAPASAIVTTHRVFDDAAGDPDAVLLVWLEGNVYGAVNLTGFVDRCLVAAHRALDAAPTSALRQVPRHLVRPVATFDVSTCRLDVFDPEALDAWLRTGH
jgi:hypothetical protein